MDCNLPDSSVHGISQARVLEWGLFATYSAIHINAKAWEHMGSES